MVEVQSRVVPGDAVNEDVVRASENCVVVLDGATGLSDRTITDAPSDGRWYVEALADALVSYVDEDRTLRNIAGVTEDRTLQDIAADAVSDVRAQYFDLPDADELESHERPSAAGVIVRWDADELEYLVLGDCSVVIDSHIETEAVIGEGPRHLDQKVVDKMVRIRDEAPGDIPYDELREQVDDLLVEHRKMKNEPEGYWTFSLDPSAVENARTGSLPFHAVDFVFAFTDGFERVCTTYDAFADWSTVAAYLQTDGIDRAIRVLRAFETSDPECRKYPRLKPSDDVGIATITPE